MTHEEFSSIAKKHGFQRVFFLAPEEFEFSENPHRLVLDAKAEFPFVSAIAVLIRAYQPFNKDELIPAYYLASNEAYFAMKALLAELNGIGIRAEKAEIPLKAALEKARIGVELKNSLRLIPPYGTRTVMMSIAVSDIAPLEYALDLPSPCKSCRACAAACPAHAIGERLNLSKCMRLRMETALHDDFVRDNQRTYIGCEICQYACPMNARLEKSAPTEAHREAFRLEALLRGETKSARALVGKNMTGGGRLTAEALAFAARDGLIPEAELKTAIEACEASPFEAVRDAARYAKDKLFRTNGKE